MTLLLSMAARQAGIFWFLGPPVWHMSGCAPWLPDRRASSRSSARPSGICVAVLHGCQTGGHLLDPRPARLAYVWLCSMLPDRRASSGSSARLSGICVVVLHGCQTGGHLLFLGPPVWHVCCRVPWSQTGGHLLVPRPACLAYVWLCSMAARQADIFWFLGPPVWHVCCRVPWSQTGGHLLVPRPACLACVLSCSMLPDRRASSGSSARLSGICVALRM